MLRKGRGTQFSPDSNFRFDEKGQQPTSSKGINLKIPCIHLISFRSPSSVGRFPDLDARGLRFEPGYRDFGGKLADGARNNFKRLRRFPFSQLKKSTYLLCWMCPLSASPAPSTCGWCSHPRPHTEKVHYHGRQVAFVIWTRL